MEPNINYILEKLHNRTPKELAEIEKAYEFAKKAHKDQKRYSGEPYFVHPFEATKILAGIQVDTPTIIATLLHDVCEDGVATPKEITKKFGKEVAFLVEGVTKLGTVKYQGIERHVENLRKMLLSMAEDIRVIIIKIADRLHNMQTLNNVPKHKQERIALETLEVYAPLANRLGMGKFKGMLEDMAFKFIYTKEYKWLTENMTEAKQKQEIYLAKVKQKISEELKNNNIKIEKIDSRVKNLFSVYQKLLRKDMDLNRIYDIVAVRIITNSIEDCYATLGIIHRLWKPVPGKIKDYIALPKPNGYQSIHTTVFCINGKVTEFQIRTQKMHEEAENGIAAHWAYSIKGKPKEGGKVNKEISWISELREWQKESAGSHEFLDSLKIDLFKNRIFVFTPKGDVIDLPDGANPLDFAYNIHTDIGNHCSGAIVNNKMVSLDYPLQNGEICDILTNKNKKPTRTWLNLVKTNYAKNKIRSYLKRELGIEIVPAVNLQKIRNYEIKIITTNRIGVVKDILAMFHKNKINLSKLNTEASDKKRPITTIRFCTRNSSLADQTISNIKKVKGVKDVKKIQIIK